MLHCLHSFCEECLDKKLVGEGGDAGTVDATIDCPTCGHETKVKYFYYYDMSIVYNKLVNKIVQLLEFLTKYIKFVFYYQLPDRRERAPV